MATDISVDLDRLDLREILLCGSDVWNQWRKENSNASVDLSGANLSGADLNGADLGGAYLSGADFSGANLGGADLNEAYLFGADLSGADLIRANLFGADLRRAYLIRANLGGAYLIRANLYRANLGGADLIRADLGEANLGGVNLGGANLGGANLGGAYLSRANLSGADLSGADLSGADLGGANLSGADLGGANLGGANLKWAKLNEADLFGAKLPFVKAFRLYLRQIIQRITSRSIKVTFSIKIFDKEIDPSDLARLKIAISNYADAAGYTAPEVLSEKRGSFFSRIRYKVARILTPDVIEEATREGEDLYRRGKENLKAQLERTGVESTQKLASATAELLKAVETLDNIVLTLGKLIVVKHTAPDGKTRTIVRTVSTEIQNRLESTPHILDDPNTLLTFLEGEPTVTQDNPLPVVPEER